jgi:hypothetical protein
MNIHREVNYKQLVFHSADRMGVKGDTMVVRGMLSSPTGLSGELTTKAPPAASHKACKLSMAGDDVFTLMRFPP